MASKVTNRLPKADPTAIRSFVLFSCLLLLSSVSDAAMYIWTDEHGVKHFSDKKPAGETEVEERALSPERPESESSSKQGDAGGKLGCYRSLSRCESQARDRHKRRTKLCRGDWRAAAAIGNALYGGARTGDGMERSCINESRESRGKRLQACRESYNRCMDSYL